ncbi:transcriptional repressor MprA [Mycolicibacterium chubuense]|uniref:Transcriptional repressor MprA n=1 Tax=Mycolicibacterium chubuense TaxID=1800 RepID=A0A0J6WDY9_MYCCU|nr:transcriptional repressor MprA [Mycolicibacterium chubuense]SPY45511.1 transcriptional regulator [Mycolicibacterium chubuense]
MRASRALVGVAAESLGEVGDVVTVPQFRVLVLLHTRGPLNLTSVAAELGVNPSNASRTCDRLIKAQLLDRRESAVDRRHVTLTIRPAGRRLVEKVTEHRRAAIERVLRSMKAGERQMVATALELFAVAAGEPDTTVGVLWPPDAD